MQLIIKPAFLSISVFSGYDKNASNVAREPGYQWFLKKEIPTYPV
jgi:hypothetical protein